MLRAFRDAGIPIDCVAGTSVGALIGAGYCSVCRWKKCRRSAQATTFADFGRWTPSWLGLATNQRMEKYLARMTPATTFAELKIPLAISATDINAGVTIYYSKWLACPAAPRLLRLSRTIRSHSIRGPHTGGRFSHLSGSGRRRTHSGR